MVLVGLLVSITLHELGHYLAAKRSGMMVTEFFLGFGPRIWSFRRGETEYGLKLIPAGAYVPIIGMNNLEEVRARGRGPHLPPGDVPRTASSPSWPASTMNFLIALVLIWVLLAVVGVTGGKVAAGATAVPRRHRGGARRTAPRPGPGSARATGS